MEKILSFYSDAKKLEQHELVIPRMVSVWLSHYCNLNCSYCLYSEMNQKRVFIDTQKFMKLLRELKLLGVEGIEFSGGGEPTVHKDCFKLAEYAKMIGFRVGMFTNALHFDWDKISNFSYIRVGLDTLNKDTFKKLKGAKDGMFDMVIKNIEELVQKSRSLSREKRPRIGVKFMVCRDNYLDIIEKAIKFGVETGVDYVHFRRVFGKEGLNEKEVSYFLGELNSAKRLFKGFIYGDFMFEDLKEPCFMAPIHSVITAEGNLLNCCYGTSDDYVIGNVFESTFEEVWYSDKHKQVMNKYTPDFCNKYTCRWRRYNNLMRDVLSGEGDFSFI